MAKGFSLNSTQIKPLVERMGFGLATDLIACDGNRVHLMYRLPSEDKFDSGWRFISGLESPGYLEDASNYENYDINTIANFDPEIIPFLDRPAGTAFERGEMGDFAEIEFNSAQVTYPETTLKLVYPSLLSRFRSGVHLWAFILLLTPFATGLIRQLTGLDPTPRMNISPIWVTLWNVVCLITFPLFIVLLVLDTANQRRTRHLWFFGWCTLLLFIFTWLRFSGG